MDVPKTPSSISTSATWQDHPGSLGALRHPDFRWFVVGTLFSNTSFWIQTFSVAWLAVEIAVRDGGTDPALYVALVSLARAIPALVFGLAGGVLADRFDRRKILLIARAGSIIISCVLAGLTASGHAGLPAVMIASSAAALIFAADSPARSAASPMLVPRQDAFSAVGIIRAIILSSSLIGPVVAGVLIGPLGVGGALIINAGLDCLAALGMRRIPPLPPGSGARRSGAWQSMRDGVTEVLAIPTLRGFVIGNAFFAVLACSYASLLPAFAHTAFDADAAEVAWLAGASGLGGVFGAIALTTMGRWRRPGRVLAGLAFGASLSLIFLGSQTVLLPAVGACFILGWLIITYYGGTGNLLQFGVPNGLRGRVLALHSTIYQGGTQLGALVVGVTGAAIGISNAMKVAGVASLVVAIVMLRTRAVREASLPRPSVTDVDEP